MYLSFGLQYSIKIAYWLSIIYYFMLLLLIAVFYGSFESYSRSQNKVPIQFP